MLLHTQGWRTLLLNRDTLGTFAATNLFYNSRSAAQKALQLDSQIPESHIALALVDYIYFWNFREAEDELRQALALDPNSAYAHVVSCWFYADAGRIPDMLNECRRAAEIDQFSPIYNISLTLAYNYARDYDHALQQGKKTVELYPTNATAIGWLGYTYERLGNYKEAMEQWIKQAKANGDEEHARQMMQTFMKSGYAGVLKKDAIYQETQYNYDAAASDYAVLGDKNAAFEALEKAFAKRTEVFFS